MTKTDLIELVARKKKLSKTDAADAVDAFLEAITNALRDGEKVILKDFFTFDPGEMADETVPPSRRVQKNKVRGVSREMTVTSHRDVKGKAAGREKDQKAPKAAELEKAKVPGQEKVKTLGTKKAREAPRDMKTKTVGQKPAATGEGKEQKASKAAAVKAPTTAKAPQATKDMKVEAAREKTEDKTTRDLNVQAVTREKTAKPSRVPETEPVSVVKEERASRVEAKKQPPDVERAVLTLGTRFKCYKCGTKFYDLGKPQPVCPSCEANQHSEEARESSKRKRRRRPHLMTKAEPTITAPEEEQDLIEVVDEVDAEYVLDVDDIVLEEGPDET
jgi:nucleoid DNA-binding protein